MRPTPGEYIADELRWSQWMGAANRGDKLAYRNLLIEISECIAAYIRARFGALPMLEDCVQECLLALHAARHTYDAQRPFRPWMFTIVQHKVIDLLRKIQRLRQADAVATTDDEPIMDNSVEALIDSSRMLQAIAPEQRVAFVLTQYAGYTAPEAARYLGISESALKSRLHRSWRAIEKQIAAEEIS